MAGTGVDGLKLLRPVWFGQLWQVAWSTWYDDAELQPRTPASPSFRLGAALTGAPTCTKRGAHSN